jgi:hypothetical protein
MNRRKASLIVGVVLLCVFLWIGSPIEFRVVSHQRIATLSFAAFLIFCFVLIIKSLVNVKDKVFKTFGLVVVYIISFFYLVVGIGHIPRAISGNSHQWEDIFVYTNNSGEKVYGQHQENGSLPFWRYMKTYYEFENGNRISLILYDFEPNETWMEEDLRDS